MIDEKLNEVYVNTMGETIRNYGHEPNLLNDKAVEVLCDLLRQLGYKDVVNMYQNIWKEY